MNKERKGFLAEMRNTPIKSCDYIERTTDGTYVYMYNINNTRDIILIEENEDEQSERKM